MKNFKYLPFALCLMASTVTMTSCGDDDPTPDSHYNKTSYEEIKVSIYIDSKATVNPFLTNSTDERNALEAKLSGVIANALSNVSALKSIGNDKYQYEASKKAEVEKAVEKAMENAKASLENQKTLISGSVTCSIIGNDKELYATTVKYETTLSAFTDNGISYYAINDKEAGVVSNTGSTAMSNYVGDIVIPEKVTSNGKTYTVTAIGPGAFYASEKLTSVTIPNTVTTLYNSCFKYTTALKKVKLPASIKKYEMSSNGMASTLDIFGNSGVTEVEMEEGLSALCENMFYQAGKLQKVVLPKSITAIPNNCFAHCKSLTDITANGTISSIGSFAFTETGIKSLKVFNFKNATVDKNAFALCKALTEIDIEDGVASIGDKCFSGCSAATKVTVAESVKNFGINVFASCSAVKEFHFKGETPATLTEKALTSSVINTFSNFSFADTKATVFVPAAKVDTYKKASVWSSIADNIKGE